MPRLHPAIKMTLNRDSDAWNCVGMFSPKDGFGLRAMLPTAVYILKNPFQM